MYKNKKDVVDFINTLKGYRGYVQFSHRAIDIRKDVFIDRDPDIEDEEGFIYEARFANKDESISIKQINDNWLVSKTPLNDAEIKTYKGIANLWIDMAQIWQKEKDEYCENMEVLKLKKVVFAGFADKGGTQ